jgi:hypothetical protein
MKWKGLEDSGREIIPVLFQEGVSRYFKIKTWKRSDVCNRWTVMNELFQNTL